MKAIPLKIILILASIALTTALVSWLKISKGNAVAESERIEVKDKQFTPDNFNLVKIDTFLNLLQRAYNPNVTHTINNEKLVVTLKGANAITKDFFNGNDALLKSKLNDYGFEIEYDKNDNEVHAQFLIKNNAVAVPNDVMIKISDKIVN